MSKQSFADRLKQLREAAGLTQPQLAERAGMNQFGIAKLEQGVRHPTWETVQALAAALGVSCEAFQDQVPSRQAEPPPPAKKGKGNK
jgi:transcriptional regulator with XRE-family HTH domain